MKEVFEKINEKVEDLKKLHIELMKDGIDVKYHKGCKEMCEDIIEIVNQVEEEYSGSEIPNKSDGWISCSERLPEEKGDYLVTCNDGKVRVWWFVVDGDFKRWLEGVNKLKPIAWQPLPEPYKPKGE